MGDGEACFNEIKEKENNMSSIKWMSKAAGKILGVGLSLSIFSMALFTGFSAVYGADSDIGATEISGAPSYESEDSLTGVDDATEMGGGDNTDNTSADENTAGGNDMEESASEPDENPLNEEEKTSSAEAPRDQDTVVKEFVSNAASEFQVQSELQDSALSEDLMPLEDGPVYTVGQDKDYATPYDALGDVGNLRAKDSAFWVMELCQDFELNGEPLRTQSELSVKIRSAEGHQYKIDALNKSQVFIVGSNSSLTFENVTLTGGYLRPNSYAGGGALYVQGMNINVSLTGNTLITGNESSDKGGALYIGGLNGADTPGIYFSMSDHASISHNKAANGGGIYLLGMSSPNSISMSGDSTIQYNETGKGQGGGITISNSIVSLSDRASISHNTSGTGGGLHISNANLSLSGYATLSHNSANSGGGLYAYYGDISMSGNAAIANNEATGSNGGGMHVNFNNVSLSDSASISGNTSGNAGGGMYSSAFGDYAILMGDNTTISDNKARTGGGLAISSNFHMSGNATISGNEATDGDGGGITSSDWMHQTTMSLSGNVKIVNNKASGNGGGINSDTRGYIQIPKGSSITFSGNEAGKLYNLTPDHQKNPFTAYEGDIVSLSVEGLNEINNFDVSTPEKILEANKKSVLNNYDINYNVSAAITVCKIIYIDNTGELVAEFSKVIQVGKNTEHTLAIAAANGMGWRLTSKTYQLIVSSGGEPVPMYNTFLKPGSVFTLNLSEAISSYKASMVLTEAPITFAINYELEDSEDSPAVNGEDNPVSYGSNDLPLSIEDASRTGYDFDGWTVDYADAELADVTEPQKDYALPASTPSEDASDVMLDVTGDITLTAHWTASAATIHYDGNKPSAASGNISGDMNPQMVTYDQNVTLASNGFSLNGYIFGGWNTDPDGISGDSYADEAELGPWRLLTDLLLYAKWTAKSDITLNFDKNADDAVAGSITSKKVTYDEIVGALPGDDGGGTPPHREGYVFDGWSKSRTAKAGDFTAAYVTNFEQALTVYAVWSPEEIPEIVPEEEDPDTPPPDEEDPDTPPPPEDEEPTPDDEEEDYVDIPTTPDTPEAEDVSDTEMVNEIDAADDQVGGRDLAERKNGSIALLSRNGKVVSQAELSEAAKGAGIPVLGIGENGIPLVGVSGYAYWSLVDLAIAAVGLLLILRYAYVYRRRQQDLSIPEDSRRVRTRLTLTIAVAIVNLLLFLLTQDFTLTPFVVVDIWTIPELILLVTECWLGHLVSRKESL
jgi:uncharacterized repeat protein (TIGR02543 family)